MQLPYYMALHNALRALLISMTAPKYAINPYNCTHFFFQNQFFENDKREKETNERVNKSCFSWRIFGGARLNTQSIFIPTTCIQLGGRSIFA